MKKLVPVQDEDGLYRDPSSGAIVNMNDTAYMQYKQKRILKEQQKAREQLKEQEINTLKHDVSSIKNELGDVKNLLNKVLEKLNHGNN